MAATDQPERAEPAGSGRRGRAAAGRRADLNEDFSAQLETWLRAEGPKSFGSLGEVFAEKSFAVIILVLMFVPALPLPTGGVTHVFEAIAALVALQMIAGRDTLWLPKRWQDKELGGKAMDKAIPFMVRRIQWFERFSKPRQTWLFTREVPKRLIGVVLLVFSAGAAFAPPFSGLDTIPSLGAVIVALSIILEDGLILGIGTIVGVGGLTLIVTLGAAAARLVKSWL